MVCNCTICGTEAETTHLELYVIGSEGTELCISCRIMLSKIVQGIMSACTTVRLDTIIKYRKKE